MDHNSLHKTVRRCFPAMNIAQINARNAKIVMEELRQIAHEKKTDVLLLQEPYSIGNKITSLGITTKTITSARKFISTIASDACKSAIAIFNPAYTVTRLGQYCNTHCVCVEIQANGCQIYAISSYFQHCDQIEPYLCHIDRILDELKGWNVIMGIDANAKSSLWYSRETDERGEILENFIAQHRLFIVNKPSSAYTYSSSTGNSNIDLTLATHSCYNSISKWRVSQDLTISDHNLITLGVNATDDSTYCEETPRYNTKKADWNGYERHIREKTTDKRTYRTRTRRFR